MTVEEAYLLASWIRDFGKEARLVMGPVPVEGQDDHYPKDRRGNDVPGASKFTIRSEKCPNRKGVEAILEHFSGSVVSFDAFLSALQKGQVKAAILAGGYIPTGKGHWFPAEAVSHLDQVPFLVVHEIFKSPLSEKAHVVFPAASWAEKEGTYINHKGLAQAIHWISTPPGESRTDGQAYLDLLGRTGLMRAQQLRKEIGEKIPSLGQLSTGHLGSSGVLPGEAPPAQAPKQKIPVH
jgi:NADH-quinone oxidoreductase subunit G